MRREQAEYIRELRGRVGAALRRAATTGIVISTKMQRTVVVRRDYLHYVPKYNRYEKRHRNIPAHVSPAFSVKEGDIVLTDSGVSVPIQRVKVMRCRPGPTTNPYIITKGQFGATEELLISPRHKVAVGSAMVEAKDLGLQQKVMKAPFNYYNLELPGWSNMCVAGVTVESLAPAKRITATVDQVKAAIAALPASQRTAETLKTLKRICQKTANGKIMVFGSF